MKHPSDSGRTPSLKDQIADAPLFKMARASDPDTSKAAAVKAQSFAGRQHKKILSVLADASYVGKTAKEIAKAGGFPSNVEVSRRMAELVASGQVVGFDGKDGRPLLKRDNAQIYVLQRDFFTAKVVLGQQQVAERMSA